MYGVKTGTKYYKCGQCAQVSLSYEKAIKIQLDHKICFCNKQMSGGWLLCRWLFIWFVEISRVSLGTDVVLVQPPFLKAHS